MKRDIIANVVLHVHSFHYIQIFLQNMTIIKTKQKPLIQEMEVSKELR